MNSTDIEMAVATRFGCRQNIIVPNVSWGLWIHECDLLVVTKAGYAIEVEIKISKADIKKDTLKRHSHNDARIKALYFAIPKELMTAVDLIPERAGIITVCADKTHPGWLYTSIERKPIVSKDARKLTLEEQRKVAHLGAMRIWDLKHTIKNHVRGHYGKLVDTYEDNRCG